MVLGAYDTVQQVAVIGQQQKARGHLIQPPDGRDGRIPPRPPRGQNVIDQLADFLPIALLAYTVSRELGIPVLALSQLSRQTEMRGDSKEPRLSDLREELKYQEETNWSENL